MAEQQPISEALGREIYERDNWTCQYCGWSARGGFNAWRHLSVDHVIRVADEGPSTPDNLVAACRACNDLFNRRSFGSFQEKRAAIQERLRADRQFWASNVRLL